MRNDTLQSLPAATDFHQVQAIWNRALLTNFELEDIGLRKIWFLENGGTAEQWEAIKKDRMDRMKAGYKLFKAKFAPMIPQRMRKCKMYQDFMAD